MDDLNIFLSITYIIGFFVIPIISVIINNNTKGYFFSHNSDEENSCLLFVIAFFWPISAVLGFFSLLIYWINNSNIE